MTGSDLSFDLVVATLDRTSPLERLLETLEHQTHRRFRVLIVDQNTDGRLTAILAAHPSLEIVHLTSAVGLSRARNVALEALKADLVAFPDDDCGYPPDLLERVAGILAERSELAGITGVAAEATGAASNRWPAHARRVTVDNVWHGGNSHTIFLRRALLDRIGGFDEAMGFGSGNPWELAEEIDVLARAVLSGALIDQDPSLVVEHVHRTFEGAALITYARQAGGGVGYILGKNRFPMRVLMRMGLRPIGGTLASLARLRLTEAHYHVAILRWRLHGYLAGRRVRSSSNRAA